MKKIRATAAFLCTLLFAVGVFALQVPGAQPNPGQTGASPAPQTSQPPQMTPSPQSTPSVPPGQPAQSPSQGSGPASNIDDQVKILSSELNLNADQQAKVKSILTDQHQQAMSVVQDNSMSREDKLTKIRSLREATISKVRQTLTPDQQPKFEQMIENMHQRQEGGGSPSGATPPAGTPPSTTSTPPPTASKPPQ